MKLTYTLLVNFVKLTLILILLFGYSIARGQDTYVDTLNCSGGTPTFFVDLSDDSDSLWISDPTERDGGCCDTDDNCVQFELTLAPDAVGIIFYVPDGCGASPSGSLFYQVDCGPLTSVGTPLCLDGEGPHVLTFCKPGNNENCYSIKSFGSPEESEDITITDACYDSLWISGLEEETVSWTSIFPGEIGEYDYLLDCTEGCDTVIVEGEPGMFYPELIQYQVCGATIGACAVTPHCDTLNVSIVPTLEVEITPIDPTICYGEVGIELFAEALGGDGDYTFLWNDGSTSSSILATEPGLYFVELWDGLECAIAYDSVEVTEYLLPITADAGEDITICAVPDPSVELSGILTGSSTGEWSGGAGVFTPDAETMDAVYTPSDAELLVGFAELYLETTDNGSCPGDIDTIRIFYPVFSTYIESEVLDVDCFGNATGAIDLDVIGGALPLVYDWDYGADTEDVTGLPMGDYTLTMTDGNGCVGVRYYEINEPPVLELASESSPISCFAVLDGGVDLTISGGTSPYTFLWDTGETTEDVLDLGAGDHDVVVTDANGCEISASFTFVEPTDLIAEFTTTPVNCFGNADGAINVTTSGGTPGYVFDWDTGEATEDLSGLLAGIYTLTVTDANGCTEIIEVTVEEPTVLSITGEPMNVLCFGDATGTIDVAVDGGIPGYTYSWDDGSVTEDLIDIPAGIYTLTVTDANGCLVVETFDVSQPDDLVIALTGEDILCFGDSTGTVELTVAGGVGAYVYDWSNGDISEDINVLIAGVYSVIITDENGCTIDGTYEVMQPEALFSMLDGTDETCIDSYDGTADLTVGGGAPPYTYAWDVGLDEFVTEEDLEDLGDGVYVVVITDDNGCTISDSLEIDEPIDFDAGPDTTLSFCTNDGYVYLETVLFATAEGEWSEAVFTGHFNPATGELNLNDLAAGEYTIYYEIPAFTECTDTIAEFTIVVHPLPDVSIMGDVLSGCPPLNVTFSNIFDIEGVDCKWYFGDGTIIEDCGPINHVYDYAGDFDVTLELTSEFGCKNSLTAESFVTIFSNPVAAFSYEPDFPNIHDPEVEFINNSFNADNYVWNFGDGSGTSALENPYHLFPATGNVDYMVELIAYNDEGCTDTAYQKLLVEDVIIFYVPNVFTPDGDDYNDSFQPVMTAGYDLAAYHLMIFNRWGELVFESYDANDGWDGTYGQNGIVSDGVYIWAIDFSETMSDKRHKIQGHVTLLK